MKTEQLRRFCVVTLTSAALLIMACVDETLVAPDQTESVVSSALSHVPDSGPGDHMLVLSREAAPSRRLLRAIRSAGGTVMNRHDEIGVVTVSGLSDAAVAALAARRDVEGIDRDNLVQWIPRGEDFTLQTDQSGAFFFPRQWNMRQIEADAAWLTTAQGAGATVAILDTGGDPFHVDLSGRYDLGKSTSVLSPGSSLCNFFGLPDEETIYDFNFHGSFVGGIVSSNGLGVASVAPDATLIAVKVLNCLGSGSFDDLIAGIMHAADVGADVINMSLGRYFSQNELGAKELVKALQRAVSSATKRGTLVVAAAGNGGINLDEDPEDFIHVPSQLEDVLSVGATGPTNQADFDGLAPYSNYGRSGIDIVAPGGNAGSTGNVLDGIGSVCSSFSVFFSCGSANVFLFGGDGTSFASPHVAGAAAVVESESAKNQKGEELGECVVKGADDIGVRGRDAMFGEGRVNVPGAVACKSGKSGKSESAKSGKSGKSESAKSGKSGKSRESEGSRRGRRSGRRGG